MNLFSPSSFDGTAYTSCRRLGTWKRKIQRASTRLEYFMWMFHPIVSFSEKSLGDQTFDPAYSPLSANPRPHPHPQPSWYSVRRATRTIVSKRAEKGARKVLIKSHWERDARSSESVETFALKWAEKADRTVLIKIHWKKWCCFTDVNENHCFTPDDPDQLRCCRDNSLQNSSLID